MAAPLFEITISKQDLKALNKRLDKLPDKIGRRLVGQATSAAMLPVLKDARARVPQKFGLLRKSLGRKRKKYERGDVWFVIVGPRSGFKDANSNRNPMNYAHLLEMGVAPHVIAAGGSGLSIGPVVIRGAVQHPGFSARPFMRPALDSNRRRVVERLTAQLDRAIQRTATKLARGS